MPSFERLHSLGVSLLLVLCLSACSSNTPAPKTVVPAPPPKKVPSQDQVRRNNISFFLRRAEQALRKGHLTQPAGASAYDYYLRVLQLQPHNSRAETGIQTIVVTYVERARDALRRRDFGEVTTLLKRAEMLAPANPLAAEVRFQLASERGRARLDAPGGEVIGLPSTELSAKSAGLVEQLQRIAERIRSEQLRVMIVARSDVEGRWIYQQLREAVPGYRVRGDIKVGNPARLILLKPSGGAL
ncbi:N-acetylglucosaminyltransferase [Microbulbifer sp. OS29]|uniref:N-acetylglucosaminyltransferase n=1 Tax=Microbulbifer okhotskensis TaxID=2926617 RepID=A0A9X2ELU2_9GAMM|nr:N-acetylglucosaminyltransferase [Microbulbifer okhotskensis]MCO1333440.1 N-acetylglucosaminyltransferase [Microbulbifer okhotskensis]